MTVKCSVPGCPEWAATLTSFEPFCPTHGTAWLSSSELRVAKALHLTAIADFARRVAAEALNGQTPVHEPSSTGTGRNGSSE